jgi:hypothetical protein
MAAGRLRIRRVRVVAPIALAVAAAVAALAVAGCGETVIDSGKAEGALKENLSRALKKKISTVECPSGVEVKPKTSFECAVNLVGGGTKTATLTILDKDADVEVTGLSAGAPR